MQFIRVKDRIINLEYVCDINIGANYISMFFNSRLKNELACAEFRKVVKVSGDRTYSELLAPEFDKLKKYLLSDNIAKVVV